VYPKERQAQPFERPTEREREREKEKTT